MHITKCAFNWIIDIESPSDSGKLTFAESLLQNDNRKCIMSCLLSKSANDSVLFQSLLESLTPAGNFLTFRNQSGEGARS